MPELPEVQALAERLDAVLRGQHVTALHVLGFSGLKTVRPRPDDLVGLEILSVGRRGKFVVASLTDGLRLLFHLGNAGRVDIEEPAKSTKGRGAMMRLETDGGMGVLVREWGKERQAGFWILADGDDGPLERLGPDAGEDEFKTLLRTSQANRRLHSLLRDQRFATGIGRGYADDILNRAGLSPFATLRSLDDAGREHLIAVIDEVLAAGLEDERTRTGGLSAPRLGEHHAVHNRTGQPCPRCGATLLRVSYESYEITYCAHCQTHDKPLADRRLSRLLR